MVPHHKPRGWIHCSALQGKRVKGQETIETANASADVEGKTKHTGQHLRTDGRDVQQSLTPKKISGGSCHLGRKASKEKR